MTRPKCTKSFMTPVLVILGLFALIAVGCGPSAPVQQPPAVEAAPVIDEEALRTLIQEAVESAATESADPKDIRGMVEDAVAANSTPGVTSEELQASVGKAVSEVLTAQEAGRQAAIQTEATPDSIILTDIAGRTVSIERPVERVILTEGRHIYVIAALQPDNPFDRIVGWRPDLKSADGDGYRKYLELFPEIDNIPEFGRVDRGDFSVEQAIALEPDVVTLGLNSLARAKESEVIDQLTEAGIAVVVVDFRLFPLENSVPSTYLLGRLFNQEKRARAFVDFYLQQVNQVYSRVAQIEEADKPLVFMDRGARLSAECCRSYGSGSLGLMVEPAGGINLGSEFLPTNGGTLNPEQILIANPDHIIATGSNWYLNRPEGGFVSLGYFTEPSEARVLLNALVEGRSGWDSLAAVKNGRYHAVWHQFYRSPYHFVALKQFAKWFHPEEFKDMDPAANFAEFHRRFLPISYSGAFFVDGVE